MNEDNFQSAPKKYIIVDEDNEYYLMNSPERYVNHSCEPNCCTDLKNQCDIALKDIKKGEEITTDYGEDHFNDKIKCNCGSKKCKRLI